MFRWMYGASFELWLGSTWSCCTASGYTPPITTAASTISETPSAGSAQAWPPRSKSGTGGRTSRRTALPKNSSAHSTAITSRIVLAGRTACTSLYVGPAQPLVIVEEATLSEYRSSQ